MILTVTPNPALDLTWRVERLVPARTHRVPAGSARAGGKGINVARVLHDEGYDVLALAPSRAEDPFALDLIHDGPPCHLTPAARSVRRSVAIVDTGSGAATVLNETGESLQEHEASALLAAAIRLGRDATVVAVCGSLPEGLSALSLGKLVEELTETGVPVIVDTSGPGLLAAARAGAFALKPNHEELAAATGLSDPLAGARTLLDAGARIVVVSLGEDGLVVLSQGGDRIRARLPQPLHGNPTGAGDAVVAALAMTIAGNPDLDAAGADGQGARERLARRATAWSASAVLAPLAGSLHADWSAIEATVIIEREEESP
ncbi:PfkB family carbohydrate kinase [Rathayibacter sp. YIM 133350]|uniref:1-phosphofructokinase family hexose kinase n=1 Tax=Rathayibacter sp. YIM 133350 TaxID=3131992 RepID=UPI00307F3A87